MLVGSNTVIEVWKTLHTAKFMSEHDLDFIRTQHAQLTPAINPSTVWLPPLFAVYLVGASPGTDTLIAYAQALVGVGALALAIAADSTSSLHVLVA